jgi:ABC-type multidrug transport system fused ATPase/permease subunit
VVVESFAGIRVVRNTNSEQREIARFKEINEAQTRVQERYARASQMLAPIAETVAVTGAMLIAGGAFVFFVRPGIMLPSYLAGFGLILVRLLPLVNQLYSLQGQLIYLSNGLKEVGKWLESPEHPSRPFGDAIFQGVKSVIRLENVNYVYPNGTPALQDVSFDIKAGTTVALVGASGSGKSTVATLLLRFRPATGGKITVDGRDFWEFSAESWHTLVAVVEQDAFLFHDSLLNNIGYGFPAVAPEAVEAAVKIAHLEDVVKALPEGLKTVVGERGTLLSGGQRQRLAIARAIVRDPQILILDEATSALDNLSEREVQTALEEAMHGRTALVIAHRLSTIRDAHHIVVLEKGRVAEQGTWEELMARTGPFSQMVNTTRDSAKHLL